MIPVVTKVGRPRRYALLPVAGTADPEIGRRLVRIDELRERVADQIHDLPREVLNHPFAGHDYTWRFDEAASPGSKTS